MNITKITNNLRTQTVTLPASHDNGTTNTSCQSLETWRTQTGESNWYDLDAVTPEYDPATHRLTDAFDPITGMLVVEEIIRTPEEIAAELSQRIKMIEDARLRHLTDNIHPDALFMVREGNSLGLPKATAFNSWCEALGMEMYHRIGLAVNGQWDWSLTDFSTFTPKPYEVGEIWQENSGTP